MSLSSSKTIMQEPHSLTVVRKHFYTSLNQDETMTLIDYAKATYHTKGLATVFSDGLQFYGTWPLRELLSKYYIPNHQNNSRCGLPEIIRVNANEIEYKSTFSKTQFPTIDKTTEGSQTPHTKPIVGLLGGPWDKFRVPFSDTVLYNSLYDRFVNGRKWEETDIYKISLFQIQNGNEAWRANNSNELKQRCEDIDLLYKSMQKDGYLLQTTLMEDNGKQMATAKANLKPILNEEYPNEARVGIGRNGEIIRFKAARHRISIAKILELEEVPVIVVVRHRQWQKVREDVSQSESLRDVQKENRKYINHPDTPDVK